MESTTFPHSQSEIIASPPPGQRQIQAPPPSVVMTASPRQCNPPCPITMRSATRTRCPRRSGDASRRPRQSGDGHSCHNGYILTLPWSSEGGRIGVTSGHWVHGAGRLTQRFSCTEGASHQTSRRSLHLTRPTPGIGSTKRDRHGPSGRSRQRAQPTQGISCTERGSHETSGRSVHLPRLTPPISCTKRDSQGTSGQSLYRARLTPAISCTTTEAWSHLSLAAQD